MAIQHFIGPGDSKLYLKIFNETGSYDKAQEAINNAILKRSGKIPKNKPIKEYLETVYSKT